MDEQSAEMILSEVLEQWDQGDNEVLGRELVKRLDLKCEPPWKSYTAQVKTLVQRPLNDTEKAQLNYFFLKICGLNIGQTR